MGLKEYLPTPDERKGLDAYMQRCGKSEEDKAKGYADLSECEKYMWKIKQVDDAARKFDCMLFRAQFRTRVDELVASIKVVENACDEVKNSESLRKVLAMILTLVNTINTGGEGKGSAQGFNLDGLLKLNEVSIFVVYAVSSHILASQHDLSSKRRKLLIRKQVCCSIS